MKIRDGSTGGLQRATSLGCSARSDARTSNVPSPMGDQVRVTGRGAEVQRARALALQAPEVRQELVARIRGTISRGEYRITGAQVLPRLLREQSFEAQW